MLLFASGFVASLDLGVNLGRQSTDGIHYGLRAEMIRRVTPWPVEPPLQIWRCPMSVSAPDTESGLPELLEASYHQAQPSYSPWVHDDITPSIRTALFSIDEELPAGLPEEFVHLAQQADIDISDPIYDFVRSIRVIDIDYSVWLHENDAGDRNCRRAQTRTRQGVYGSQGDFRWEALNRSDPAYPEPTWLPFNVTMQEGCPVGAFRGVGIEWRDHEGNHSYEVITY